MVSDQGAHLNWLQLNPSESILGEQTSAGHIPFTSYPLTIQDGLNHGTGGGGAGDGLSHSPPITTF